MAAAVVSLLCRKRVFSVKFWWVNKEECELDVTIREEDAIYSTWAHMSVCYHKRCLPSPPLLSPPSPLPSAAATVAAGSDANGARGVDAAVIRGGGWGGIREVGA